MIEGVIGRAAVWTAERGPPTPVGCLSGLADTRWERAASQVAGSVIGHCGTPASLVVATTRPRDLGENLNTGLARLAAAMGTPRSGVVTADVDTLAMALLESATLALAHGSALLLAIDLTDAAELAVALWIADSGNGVPFQLREVQRRSPEPQHGLSARNPLGRALSLFETVGGGVVVLDSAGVGGFEVELRGDLPTG